MQNAEQTVFQGKSEMETYKHK